MGKQIQIALDDVDFMTLLNKLSDWNFRLWRYYKEIPDPLHAPIVGTNKSHDQFILTFPDSRIAYYNDGRIKPMESDYIEINLCYFRDSLLKGSASKIFSLCNGRIYLNTYRMHYTLERQTLEYYDEDEYHLCLLKKRYETMCRIIKKEAVAIMKDGSYNLYIWPHAYEQMLKKGAGILFFGAGAELPKDANLRYQNGARPSDFEE